MPDIFIDTSEFIGAVFEMGSDTDAIAVVTAGTTVASTFSYVIRGNGNDQSVFVDGSIFSDNGGIQLSGGGVQTISVSQSGSVAGRFALFYAGTLAEDFVVLNAGSVMGDEWAIFSDDTLRLDNSGVVSASGTAGGIPQEAVIWVVGDLEISNSGVISASNEGARAIAVDVGPSSISNTGDIIGGIALSAADDAIVNIGSILGDIDFADGSGSLENGGMIAGEIAFGGRGDMVTNTGTVLGNIELGSGADIYEGAGVGLVTETVFGGNGDDILTGGASTDRFDGGNDSDSIRGRGGDDVLAGGGGTDSIAGGSGDDEIDGGGGADVLGGGSGDDIIFGGNGNDSIAGGRDDDALFAGEGEDILRGGAGADLLAGNGGADLMFGGAGADTFFWFTALESALGAQDEIGDFASGDRIDLSALSGDTLVFAGDGSYVGGGTGSVRTLETATETRVLVDVDGNGTTDMRIDVLGDYQVTESDFLL